MEWQDTMDTIDFIDCFNNHGVWTFSFKKKIVPTMKFGVPSVSQWVITCSVIRCMGIFCVDENDVRATRDLCNTNARVWIQEK